MTDIQVPVLIVGGGGAGLSASMILSTYGVEALLVSALPKTSILPKAHVLSQRTMEVFTEVGVAEPIYEKGTPAENLVATGWYAGVAGPHADYGRRIGRMEIWGAGYRAPEYVDASPCRTANLPQVRLEPVMKAHAESLAPESIRFNHELVALTQDADGVTSVIRDRATGEEYPVRSQYVIAADAGRTVGPMVGITLEGERNLLDMVSVHMTADLSEYLDGDEEVLLRWLANPDLGGTMVGGVLCPMGPDNWGTKSEEWVFHLGYPHGDTDTGDGEKVLARMRANLGIEDFDPQIHAISVWTMEGIVADRWRVGRVFVAGDAAHRHPPTGGLGLNSAVHDVQNLCWKLAAVLAGRAGDALLDTYEVERKPVVTANTLNSIASTHARFRLDEVLGLSPENSPEQNWSNLRVLWDPSHPDYESRIGDFDKALAAQSLEFHHHKLDYGFTYASEATVDSGGPEYVPLDPVRLYEPSTKPGHPLPHAWVSRRGDVVPLGHYTHGGKFLLVAGEDGMDWVEAARKVAATHNIPMEAWTVGVDDGDLADLRLAWLRKREISRRGAVLVRPDRFVGFRSMDAVDDPEAALVAALSQILATELA